MVALKHDTELLLRMPSTTLALVVLLTMSSMKQLVLSIELLRDDDDSSAIAMGAVAAKLHDAIVGLSTGDDSSSSGILFMSVVVVEFLIDSTEASGAMPTRQKSSELRLSNLDSLHSETRKFIDKITKTGKNNN